MGQFTYPRQGEARSVEAKCGWAWLGAARTREGVGPLPHFILRGRAAGAGKRERKPVEIGRRLYLRIG